MKITEIKRKIKGVFLQPKKKYYLGKIIYGDPYMYPTGFLSTIVNIRKLKLRSVEDTAKYMERYPYTRPGLDLKFTNIPMVRRNKYWIVKLFDTHYMISIGKPFAITTNELGWKDKNYTPRFEWSPSFKIYFFIWQFCIFWVAPHGDVDKYYEMIVWYLKYHNSDIKEAENNWDWIDGKTHKSTWDKSFLCH